MTALFLSFFFFFNDTATTEIYTLSLHDALPISFCSSSVKRWVARPEPRLGSRITRSEEHTSELQSRQYLVCRLLLEKKKRYNHYALSQPATARELTESRHKLIQRFQYRISSYSS